MLSPTLSLIFMQLQSEKKKYIYIRFYLLVKSLFEVKFEICVICSRTHETYRSGVFLDPRGDFAGLGMAPLEFNDYAHVVRYRGGDNGIRLLQNSIHNSKQHPGFSIRRW